MIVSHLHRLKNQDRLNRAWSGPKTPENRPLHLTGEHGQEEVKIGAKKSDWTALLWLMVLGGRCSISQNALQKESNKGRQGW